MLHYIHHPLHPLKVLWIERITLFWPIWMAITAIGVIVVIWVVSPHEDTPLDSVPLRRRDWSRAAFAAVILLGVFLVCYVAGSLTWEDFTYYDNSFFTNATLLGRDIPTPIVPEAGRFTPLAFQEFNLVRHVTSSVDGYHVLPIVQLLLLCGILLFLDEELKIQARVALIMLALITPGILISFNGLIYLERNVIFCVVCLAWFVKCFEQTRAAPWAVGALLSSQCMLYFKEVAFLLLLSFVFGRLVLRCWKVERSGWDFSRLRDPESRLDLCLAVLVVPFLVYYFAAMYPHYHTSYADNARLPLRQVLASYLELDPLACVLVAVVVARIFLILRRKSVPSPLWDGLALGGVGYFGGYIILRMSAAYYLAPADLIAVLYLGHLTMLSWANMRLVTKSAVLALVSLVCVQDLSLSAFRMYERKNVIHAKAEMGRVIQAHYAGDSKGMKRLFFPFATPFQIMEFASYLNYLGVPVEGGQVISVRNGSVDMVGRAVKTEGPCGYRTFVCHAGSWPDSGDLIVVFPDDFTSNDELNLYLREGTGPLISYHPRPSIPQWLRPYVDRLHIVSPVFAYERLPDLWLDASVTPSN